MNDRHIDFTVFTAQNEGITNKPNSGFESSGLLRYSTLRKEYSQEEITSILAHGSLSEQQKLSRDFFYRDGLYKKTIFYYASLLMYASLVIPNPSKGKKLSDSFVNKRYDDVMIYLEKANLKELFTNISIRALVDGCYYGVIQTLDKQNLVLFDLPSGYARSRYKDLYGNDLVEFNVEYFDSLKAYDGDDISDILRAYPKEIRSHYKKWSNGRVTSPWIRLDANVGVSFSFSEDCRPLFLSMIPAILQYDEALDTERERALDEIRKIIVQKVPHLTDGQLLFEPDEALEMHKGTVKMLSGNPNIAVLTTYADVDSIVSRTTADNVSSTLEKMLESVYVEAGVSPQLFAPTSSQALNTSIKNDITLMMILGNKYARFVTYALNHLFGNGNISFTYIILPVSLYNQSDYITDMLKLAQSGFSFLHLSAAAGINQYELMNIKELENNILKLGDILKPLASSYTNSKNDEESEPGAPTKDPLEQAQQTIRNQQALDNAGGSQ